MEKDDFLVIVSLLLFVFSLFSVFSSYNDLRNYITGNVMFNSSGMVNITIGKTLFYDFTVSEINWSHGYVYASRDFATLDTLGNVGNGTWDAVERGFEIVNLGNTNLTVNLSSGKDADTFIGGTSPLYQYNVTELNDSACTPGGGFNLGEFYNVSASPSSREICSSFNPNRNIRIDLKLIVPLNSLRGNLTDSFTLAVSDANP